MGKRHFYAKDEYYEHYYVCDSKAERDAQCGGGVFPITRKEFDTMTSSRRCIARGGCPRVFTYDKDRGGYYG
jgi:hypothetical protein